MGNKKKNVNEDSLKIFASCVKNSFTKEVEDRNQAISDAISKLEVLESPNPNGQTTAFIDTITQKNGKIIATKKGIVQASATDWGIVKASSISPKMNGTATLGSETSTFARGDHVHPTDTSRAPKSHASTSNAYGLGTTSNYGHVKISNGDVNTVASANGLVAGMDHTHGNYSLTTHNHDSTYLNTTGDDTKTSGQLKVTATPNSTTSVMRAQDIRLNGGASNSGPVTFYAPAEKATIMLDSNNQYSGTSLVTAIPTIWGSNWRYFNLNALLRCQVEFLLSMKSLDTGSMHTSKTIDLNFNTDDNYIGRTYAFVMSRTKYGNKNNGFTDTSPLSINVTHVGGIDIGTFEYLSNGGNAGEKAYLIIHVQENVYSSINGERKWKLDLLWLPAPSDENVSEGTSAHGERLKQESFSITSTNEPTIRVSYNSSNLMAGVTWTSW